MQGGMARERHRGTLGKQAGRVKEGRQVEKRNRQTVKESV